MCRQKSLANLIVTAHVAANVIDAFGQRHVRDRNARKRREKRFLDLFDAQLSLARIDNDDCDRRLSHDAHPNTRPSTPPMIAPPMADMTRLLRPIWYPAAAPKHMATNGGASRRDVCVTTGCR